MVAIYVRLFLRGVQVLVAIGLALTLRDDISFAPWSGPEMLTGANFEGANMEGIRFVR